jgi:multiple sugar transport system permease protein
VRILHPGSVSPNILTPHRPQPATPAIRPTPMPGGPYFQQLNVLWGQIMAYSTLITIPVLAFFLVFQRSFISSIASAGVKG